MSRLSPAQAKRANFKVGAIVLVVFAVLIYFGFTKSNPFASHFEVQAAFDDIVTLKAGAPVRIAGVNVGKVTKVEAPDDASRRGALVTLRIDDNGLPVHKDATVKIRPRIFLEGNTFVELKPGSPSVANLRDGDVIPATRTSSPVGFGQLLEALQSNTREDLQTVLKEYGIAVTGAGAKGINGSIKYWRGAYRDSAIVNDALRGVDPHDLSDYIASAGTVAEALDRDPEALKSLVTNFAITAGAFASEQDNLRLAVQTLPQTLDQGYSALGALNAAFPSFRRLINALRPAVRSSGPALDAQLPLLQQLRGLLSAPEMGGLSTDLRRVVPDLVELSKGGVALQTQARRLASCQVNNVIPTGNATIQDANFPATGRVFEEGVKWLPGISSESRSFDANGQYIKTSVRGGLNLVYQFGDDRFFATSRPLLGVNPPKSKEPALRPDVACETQDRPDLRSRPGQVPAGHRIKRSGALYDKRYAKAEKSALTWLRRQLRAEGLSKTLKTTLDPITKQDLPRLAAAARKAQR